MNAVFVDCTPELSNVMQRMKLPLPSWITIHHGNPSEGDLKTLCSEAQLLLVEHTVISTEMLQSSRDLKGIVFMGTGAGTYIPLVEAARRGIKVSTTPGYANRAVAEHTMALLFSAARQVARMDREIRYGVWAPRGGVQLQGRKIAVIGLGGIGAEFGHMAQALGMRVAGWNNSPSNLPFYVSDLDAALSDADVVTLHLALNEQTEGLLNAARLQLLAPGAVLVNTARAQLVEEKSLIVALKDGHVAHAALDVFTSEPLPIDSEWRTLENVTLTSHAAYMTEEAYAQLWRRAIEEAEKLRAAF